MEAVPTLEALERDTSRFQFDEFEINVPAFELRRGGLTIPLEPQVFDVLLLLVRNCGRILTKDEILDAIWPERYVTEAALNSRIMSARKALGDDGRQQRFIKTIHGRGYRFVGAVSAAEAPPPALSVDGRPLAGESGAKTANASPAHVMAPPTPGTSFVGRSRELASLGDLLDHRYARLISVVGPGGMGKTRLVLETIRDRAREGPPICYVPLETVTDMSSATVAIAAGVGVALTNARPWDQVVDALRNQKLLLVLDNFEQLVDEGAELISALLQAAPEVRVVLTSRAVLGLAEEWVFRVDGLDFEGESSAAVALYRQRTRQWQAAGEDDGHDLAAILDFCALVEGMPLALELAASLARYSNTRDLVESVKRDPQLLASTIRNLPERHRSLAALFTEACNRLSAAEMHTMQSLAVFTGSFSASAAGAVSGASLPALYALADQSFVQVTDGRFHLHPLVRQYARELGADRAEVLREAHAEYFARFLDDRRRALEGAGQLEATREIEAELPNLTRAWAWACATGRADLLDSALPLFTALSFRGRFLEADELARLAVPGLEAAGAPYLDTLGQVRVSQAWALLRTGRPGEALAAARAAWAIYADGEVTSRPGIGRDPRMPLAAMQFGAGNYAGAFALCLEAREHARERGDRTGQAFAAWLGGLCRMREATVEWVADAGESGGYRAAAGDEAVPEAAALVQEAGTILEGLHESWLRGLVELERGVTATAGGYFRGGIPHFERARSLRAAFNDPHGVASAEIYLADQYLGLGERQVAAEHEAEARKLALNSGDATGLAEADRVRARILLAVGDAEGAVPFIVGAIERSLAVAFANNVGSGIRIFGEYAEAAGRPGLAAEAFAWVAVHPSSTPFGRARSVADLQRLAEAGLVPTGPDLRNRLADVGLATMARLVLAWLSTPSDRRPSSLFTD